MDPQCSARASEQETYSTPDAATTTAPPQPPPVPPPLTRSLRRAPEAAVAAAAAAAAEVSARSQREWSIATLQKTSIGLTLVIFAVLLQLGLYVMREETPAPPSPFVQDSIAEGGRPVVHTSREQGVVASLLEGYARMRDVCDIIAREEGWRGMSAPTPALHDYDPRTALSASPSQPYFCINHLLNAYAGDDVLSMRRRQDQKWAAVNSIRSHIPSDSHDLAEQVLEVISITRDAPGSLPPKFGGGGGGGGTTEGDEDGGVLADAPHGPLSDIGDLSQAPVAHLGYLTRAFLYRDLLELSERIGGASPRALLRLMAYDTVRQFAADLELELDDARLRRSSREEEQPAYCVCGPHMAMARNLVLYVSSSSSRLYVEPKLESLSGPTSSHGLADMPWNDAESNSAHGPLGASLVRTDAALRAALDLSQPFHPLYAEATVDSVRLSVDTQGKLQAMNAHQVSRSHGGEAYCLQYCHQLAFAMQDASRTLIERLERLPI